MHEKATQEAKNTRLFVACISTLALAVAITNIIVNMLLIEIAQTFQVNEGIAAQIRTTNAFAELATALIVGFFALRFKHKSLLTIGALLVAFSAIGSFLAPTLSAMMLFSLLEGTGTVIVLIMAYTLIGDLIPANQKSKAISWVVAGGFIATIIITPLIDIITNIAGWRYTFLLPILPIAIATLALSTSNIQSTNPSQKTTKNKPNYFEKIKHIFHNTSALSCLIGTLFFTGAGSAVFIFAFLRQEFSIPREYTVYIIQAAAIIFIIGSIITGKATTKIGSKPLATIGSLGSGIFLILLFTTHNPWLALTFNFIQVTFTAICLSAYPTLTVDQIEHSRSTMMSLTRVFSNIGNTLAPAIAGTLFAILTTQSTQTAYQIVGITFGTMNIISATTLLTLTKDPHKQKTNQNKKQKNR
jgi:predicted MFS family arabinose efflux permease